MSEQEIRKNLGTEKLILGTERTMKALKKEEVKKIFLAKNINEETKKDIEYYAELTGIEKEELEMTNEELGTMCKQQFSISVIGLKK